MAQQTQNTPSGATGAAQGADMNPLQTSQGQSWQQIFGGQDKPVQNYNPVALARRWISTVGIAVVFGGSLGGLASYSSAKEEAEALSTQAGLSQRTMPGLQQYRLTMQRAVARGVLRGATKFGVFTGVFAGMELGMTYYRGVWDAWNPLLSGTAAGGLFGMGFGSGIRGVWVGSVLGGVLALPVALVEIGIRYLLPEEEIFPVMEIKSDPPQSVSKSLAEELELQLDMQKHFEQKQGQSPPANQKK